MWRWIKGDFVEVPEVLEDPRRQRCERSDWSHSSTCPSSLPSPLTDKME